jgi:hypothetical protein
VFLGVLAYSLGYAIQLPKWFPFGKKNALKEWEEKIFRGRVLYKVEVDNADGYLSAYSKNAASGIFYKMAFSPRIKPMISWKWKVVKFPAKEHVVGTDDGWIEKDDYAARLYVIFPGFLFSGTRSIEYVWDKELPGGTVLTSPYFKNIKIIVAESGAKNLDRWVFEERDICEDYKRLFGRVPGKVGAIAIMTDTDNTLSVAEAHYDEIKVGYEK